MCLARCESDLGLLEEQQALSAAANCRVQFSFDWIICLIFILMLGVCNILNVTTLLGQLLPRIFSFSVGCLHSCHYFCFTEASHCHRMSLAKFYVCECVPMWRSSLISLDWFLRASHWSCSLVNWLDHWPAGSWGSPAPLPAPWAQCVLLPVLVSSGLQQHLISEPPSSACSHLNCRHGVCSFTFMILVDRSGLISKFQLQADVCQLLDCFLILLIYFSKCLCIFALHQTPLTSVVAETLVIPWTQCFPFALFFSFSFLRQGLILQPRLAWNHYVAQVGHKLWQSYYLFSSASQHYKCKIPHMVEHAVFCLTLSDTI